MVRTTMNENRRSDCQSDYRIANPTYEGGIIRIPEPPGALFSKAQSFLHDLMMCAMSGCKTMLPCCTSRMAVTIFWLALSFSR